jgi:pimeloyl-ACP methyl ester carboxylesterase
MKTIVFLSGFSVPSFVSKSSWFFEEPFWEGYNTIFYKSRTPTSDRMVVDEMDNLIELMSPYSDVSVVGHSLGGWWAANLACNSQSKISKVALWTPLGIASEFPIFPVSWRSEPGNKIANSHNVGPDKVLLAYAVDDLIVPYKEHALPFRKQFDACTYALDGGHMWQTNHKDGLQVLKNWLGK